MRILIGCESSGVERRAFREAGHEAYSCDLLPADDRNPFHFQDDVLRVMREGGPWDVIVCHPPCTFLSNSGVRWLYAPDDPDPKKLKGSPRWAAMIEGAKFFNECRKTAASNARTGSALENPTMHAYAGAICGSPNFSFQPWQHGDRAFKRVCWWLDRLPPLVPTLVLSPPAQNTPEHRKWSAVHRAAPSDDRWKTRSLSFTGPAKAMAEQWAYSRAQGIK